MTLHLFVTCWTPVGLFVSFESVSFHQTSAHGASILRVLLRVGWLQGGSASTLDGDWPLCACSLLVVSCFMNLILWLCLVFSFVSSEVRPLSQETKVSWFILVATFNHRLHSIMDPPYIVYWSLRQRFLHTVWRTGSMGCRTCLFLLTLIYLSLVAIDSDSIVTTGVPWCGLSTW